MGVTSVDPLLHLILLLALASTVSGIWDSGTRRTAQARRPGQPAKPFSYLFGIAEMSAATGGCAYLLITFTQLAVTSLT